MNSDITADYIKETRQRYGLSQKSFALLLGIGPASMVRYEQGSKPTKANANLIRAAQYPQFMMDCLERSGDLIPESQHTHASSVAYALVSLDPEPSSQTDSGQEETKAKEQGAAMVMNEMYELTLRQEILNEKAANLACEIMQLMIASGIDSSDESNALSAMLRQLFVVKSSIVSYGLGDADALTEISGYLHYLDEYLEALRSTQQAA